MTATGETVLVVDDNHAFRELVREWLGRAGFAVVEAGDADAALRLLDEEPPALVVLDVKLPGVSGYELMQELRDRLGGELPIIFVSGERVDSYDRIAGLLLGADDYLAKPFDPDELLARVRRALRPRRGATAPTARTLADRAARLTDREREVLHQLAAGRTSVQIADELVISPRTVDTHVQNILTKLGARNRLHAVTLGHIVGLFAEAGSERP